MLPVEIRIAKLFRKYNRLTGRFLSLGTVESASGGKISDRITNVAGSSDYFKGAVVAYSNEIKTGVVGIKQVTLEEQGAVSYQIALEMADFGRQALSVDICVADTGIAGPTGDTSKKPLGLFFIAIACSDGYKRALKFNYSGSRINNKKSATVSALNLLEKYLITKLKSVSGAKFEEKRVVTCIIKHKDKILLLRRSDKVGTYKGKWSGVSGYLEKNITEQAYTEIREEINLQSDLIRLVKKAGPIKIIDENLRFKWIVYPMLFKTDAPERIHTDWENTEIRWVKPEDIGNYDTVPGLAKVVKAVT